MNTVSLFRAVGLMAGCAFASMAQAPTGNAVQVIVTAEARHGKDVPPVSQNDVNISSGKDPLTISDWVSAQGQPLQILLLLDESSNTNLGTQFGDLKQFIGNLPQGAQVAVGYMRNGTVEFAQPFTPDHALAATKLRLPLGYPGANASPYFSLVDLLKRWQPIAGRREILMVTDGIDRFGGTGPDNPYVNEAIDLAQRGGVMVSSIYWGGVGHYGHSYFRLNWGQNYLSQMADATGGEAYWQGFGNPVAFTPYLEDFTERLNHQYLLTFQPKPRNKAGFEQVRIRTELKDVELVGPSQIWVPAQ